jgi:competence protein ComFB
MEEKHLKNVMEELVFEKLDELMEKIGSCQCDNCRMDSAAYALNHLPPKYVVTDRGELLSKTIYMDKGQYEMDVTMAIINGIDKVMEHPRHNE